jgi:hypothetical protein
LCNVGLPVLRFLLLFVCACSSSDVSRSVGARCDLSSECEDRCLAPSIDWPGGFCTLTCDADNDCPDDTACVIEGDSGICAFICTASLGCTFLGEGYDCVEVPRQMQNGSPAKVCRG